MAETKEEMGRIASHLRILNSEMGAVQADMEEVKDDIVEIKVATAEIKTDISWLKRMQIWIIGLIGSGFVAAVCYALFNRP